MTVHGRLSPREVTTLSIVDGLVGSPAASQLVGELVEALAAHHPAARITVLQPSERADGWSQTLSGRVDQRTATVEDWIPWVTQQIVDAECVWTLGVEAARQVAGSLPKHAVFHAILLDEPERDPRFLPGHKGWLTTVARRATAVWFNDEQVRSTAEAVAPTLCERTRVFRPVQSHVDPPSVGVVREVRLVQPVACLTPAVGTLLHQISEDLLANDRELKLHLVGTPDQFDAQAKTMSLLPVLPWSPDSWSDSGTEGVVPFALIDDSRGDGLLQGPAVAATWQAGALPVPASRVSPALLCRAVAGDGVEILDVALRELPGHQLPRLADHLPPTNMDATIAERDRTRVVLVGADLKFAAPLVSAFVNDPGVDLLIDPVKGKDAGPDLSAKLADWADVVICEFMNAGAIWYSQHLPAGKKLIVHLHGYELWAEATDQVVIDRVDTVVVVSEFYRQTVLDYRGWPADKVVVLPNATSALDLDRPKDPDARFHLGLVGWVPSLKRPDRALDLLEELLQHDDRYHLTIRGALPWNYPWEWQKPTHQDTYYEFLERLRAKPELSRHITFEPFGADVGNWLRSVGWMLSTSVRETFHLAPVEGMISGAIPVVWDREGAEEIFTAEFVVSDHHEAARRILTLNESHESYATAQERARALALARYDQRDIEGRWLALVTGPHGPRLRQDEAFAHATRFIQESVRGAREGDFDAAVGVLDQHISETVKAHGFTKQHELFVRGVQELRFRLLRDGVRAPQRSAFSMTEGVLLVQVPEVGRSVPSDAWGARHTVLVAPAPGDPTAPARGAEHFRGYAPSIPTLGVDASWLMRFDRYVDVITSQMSREIQAAGTTDILVDGPLWVVYAALQAARTMGGEVWWDLSQGEASDWAWLRTAPALLTDDPAEALSAYVLGSVAGVVVPSGAIPDPLLTMLPPDRMLTRTELLAHRVPEEPSPAVRRPAPLTVAAVVGDALAAELAANPDVDLRRVDVHEVDALDARTQVCVVDTDEFLGQRDTTEVMAALDRIRGRGVRSVVIESQGSLPFEKLSGYYARADVFAAHDRESLALQAARTVQAVGQLVLLPEANSSLGIRPLERVLGLGVRPLADPLKAHAVREVSDGDAPRGVGDDLGTERLPDTVSVVIPAYRNDDSVFAALDSVCQQSVPANRVEIVVVANGPGTELIPRLTEFAEQHAGPAWVIEESAQGASVARNRALDLASGDYITFLDDDDVWEPNHLAAMLAVAAPDTVVISEIIDMDDDGTLVRNTASRRRLLHLGSERRVARSDPGLFTTTGARLIHRDLIGSRRFDERLTSGEDVAFLSGLLADGRTLVTGAYELPNRSYVRARSLDSVSRPGQTDVRWGVHDRLGVLREVWLAARGADEQSSYVMRANLADPQVMFMERYLEKHPADVTEVARALDHEDSDFLEYVAWAAAERAPLVKETLDAMLAGQAVGHQGSS